LKAVYSRLVWQLFDGPTLIEPNAEWALFRNDRHSSVGVDPMSRIVQDQPLSICCTVEFAIHEDSAFTLSDNRVDALN
jgi:hypothetical protein